MFSVKGKKFNSLTECYKANQDIARCSLRRFYQRVQEGMPIEKAITTPLFATRKNYQFTVEGVQYYLIKDIADAYNLPMNTVYKRFSRGKKGDDLIPENKRKNYVKHEPIKKEEKLKFYVKGIGYKSGADACRKNNVKYVTFIKRLQWGWTESEALGIDQRKNISRRMLAHKEYHGKKRTKGKEAIVNGRVFNSVADAARFYKRNPDSVANMMRIKKLTLEQVLNVKPYETSNTIKYKGKIYKNLKHLSKEINFPFNLLRSRTQYGGMSPSDAIALGREKILNQGKYNASIFYKNPILASSIGTLYFVALTINNQEKFKIGITKQSVKHRMIAEGFKYKIIQTVKLKLYECYKIEQELIKKYDNYKDKHVRSKDLDGYTEIFNFSNNIVKEISNLIKYASN